MINNLSEFAAFVLDAAEVDETSNRQILFQAFSTTSRDHFIEPAFQDLAYTDLSLPIGFGQTISKPSTVARMLSCLKLKPGQRVLEVGAGSGYVTALLMSMSLEVFAVERNSNLAKNARRKLDEIGLGKTILRCSDGRRGWLEFAPYDAILISAAFDEISTELLNQLRVGARLVAPLNQNETKTSPTQILKVWTRLAENNFGTENLGPCNFVQGI